MAKYILRFLICWFLGLPFAGDAQLYESFETGLPTAYDVTTSYTLGSGIWTGQANGLVQSATGSISGNYALQLRSQTGAQIVGPALSGGVSEISFYVSSSTVSGGVQVNYSIDDGLTWVAAGNSPFTGIGTAPVLKTAIVNSNAPGIRIQFYRTAATIYIGDVVIHPNCNAPSMPTGTINGISPACANGTLSYIHGTGQPEGGISYYWQSERFGRSPAFAAGNALTTNSSGKYYVRAFNSIQNCWSHNSSSPMELMVNPQATITTSPPSTVNAVSGDAVSLNFNAANFSSLLWQYSTDAGASWADLDEAGAYTGTTTNLLVIGNTTESMNGYRYRGEARGITPCNDVNTSAVVLNVGPGPCLDEGFDGGSATPPGWTFSGVVNVYTNAINSGRNTPAISLDDDGDRVVTPILGAPAAELYFWIKGQGTNATSALLIEGFNGSSWITVASMANIPTQEDQGHITFNAANSPAMANNDFTRFRFTYSKSAGNLALDDVIIRCRNINICSGKYYRSSGSGSFSDPNVWEVSNDKLSWSSACAFPQSWNNAEVSIRNGHSVSILNAHIIVNSLIIEEGGKLTTPNALGSLTILNGNTSGPDFVVNGTFEENASAATTTRFRPGATWLLADQANAKMIKTNAGGAGAYRDNYHGGISNMGANALWIYDKGTATNVQTVSRGMVYPNLTFINSGPADYAFEGSLNALTGSTENIRVNGNLELKSVSGRALRVDYNNVYPFPFKIGGNLIIGENTIIRNDHAGISSGSYGVGTGLEVLGNLVINGTLDFTGNASNPAGILKLSGSIPQLITGSPVEEIRVQVFELNNESSPSSAAITSNVPIHVFRELRFTEGILSTNSTNKLTLFEDAVFQNAGSARFINGPVSKKMNAANPFVEFPVGKINGTVNNGYRPVRFDLRTGDCTMQAEYFFAIPPTPSNTCGGCESFHAHLQGIQNNEFWNVIKTSAGAMQGIVKMEYRFPGEDKWRSQPGYPVSIHYAANVAITKRNTASAGQWQWAFTRGAGEFEMDDDPGLETVHHLNSPKWLQTAPLNDFGTFTTGFGLPIILDLSQPFRLVSFTGEVNNGFAELQWQMEEVRELVYTEVEYSKPGGHFIRLATQPTLGHDYAFRHLLSGAGLHFFRLKFYDINGKHFYSPVLELHGPLGEQIPVQWLFHPGTQKGKLLLQSIAAGQASWQLFSMHGQLISRGNIRLFPGQNIHEINMPGLQSGVYFLRIQVDSETPKAFQFVNL